MKVARLYVTGQSASLRWCVAPSLVEAMKKLGKDARVPDSDDMRFFWIKSGIAEMSIDERAATFGVSRQTLNNWRRKGGSDLQKVAEVRKGQKTRKCQQLLRDFPDLHMSELLHMTRLAAPQIRKIAADMGITIVSKHKKIPSDEELVKLANGRTWRELAEVAGVKLATLRAYIYSKPALADEVRKVRKAIPAGPVSQGKLDLIKVREMGKKGMTAYAIAEVLKCEMMTIRNHLKKWGKESPREFPKPYGTLARARKAVARRNGRKPVQSQ